LTRIPNSKSPCPFYEVPVPGMKAKVKYHRGWGDLKLVPMQKSLRNGKKNVPVKIQSHAGYSQQ